MAGYLQQDYLFIDGFIRLLATADAHAPSLADRIPEAQFLALVTGTENTYFLRCAEALDFQPLAQPARQTLAFQHLMDQARRSRRYEVMLAVLVVAEWVYLDWASPFAGRAPDLPFWFGEWISLHSGAGFESVVTHLRGQLDAAWDGLDEAGRARVERVFCIAVRPERDFFDAAYAGFAVAR
jgi:thiaminase (transcriptional activator TenA)